MWIVCLLVIVLSPALAWAQPWAGIIAANRATDWSTAGATIVDRTTQCGATIAAYSGTAATINTALASAACANRFVLLGPGTFTLSTGLVLGQSNVTLRGSGAGTTKLIINGSVGIPGTCCLVTAVRVGASGSNIGNTSTGGAGPNNSTSWTGGYAKGTTVITLGGHTNLTVGSTIFLDQVNDSVVGQTVSEWPGVGDLLLCSGGGSTFGGTQPGCSWEGGNAYARDNRAHVELHEVTACGTSTAGAPCTSDTVTITPGIHSPAFRSTQSPGAWWADAGNEVHNSGVENLTIDFTGAGGSSGVSFVNAAHCWHKGLRLIHTGTTGSDIYHTQIQHSRAITVRDGYFYGPGAAGNQRYTYSPQTASHLLLENNIFHHNVTPMGSNDPEVASVYAYNYVDDAFYSPGPQAHNSGDMLHLVEGNNYGSWFNDDIHGTHFLYTFFRNHVDGTSHNTTGVTSYGGLVLWPNNRFFNVIGNVFGSTAFTVYEVAQTADCFNCVYSLGWHGSHGGTGPLDDPRVKATMMRWGNYDNVTNTIRFQSAEVPSSITNFANPVPASQVLPASLYRSSVPSWWGTPFGTPPWPPIGPDVTGGPSDAVLGGGARAAGHANKIPARLCFENTINDPAYPSSNPRIKLFTASNCYSAGAGVSPPAAPSNLTISQ